MLSWFIFKAWEKTLTDFKNCSEFKILAQKKIRAQKKRELKKNTIPKKTCQQNYLNSNFAGNCQKKREIQIFDQIWIFRFFRKKWRHKILWRHISTFSRAIWIWSQIQNSLSFWRDFAFLSFEPWFFWKIFVLVIKFLPNKVFKLIFKMKILNLI